jgi:hypothetical protein
MCVQITILRGGLKALVADSYAVNAPTEAGHHSLPNQITIGRAVSVTVCADDEPAAMSAVAPMPVATIVAVDCEASPAAVAGTLSHAAAVPAALR